MQSLTWHTAPSLCSTVSITSAKTRRGRQACRHCSNCWLWGPKGGGVGSGRDMVCPFRASAQLAYNPWGCREQHGPLYVPSDHWSLGTEPTGDSTLGRLCSQWRLRRQRKGRRKRKECRCPRESRQAWGLVMPVVPSQQSAPAFSAMIRPAPPCPWFGRTVLSS